jgi:hypothetical protein
MTEAGSAMRGRYWLAAPPCRAWGRLARFPGTGWKACATVIKDFWGEGFGESRNKRWRAEK